MRFGAAWRWASSRWFSAGWAPSTAPRSRAAAHADCAAAAPAAAAPAPLSAAWPPRMDSHGICSSARQRFGLSTSCSWVSTSRFAERLSAGTQMLHPAGRGTAAVPTATTRLLWLLPTLYILFSRVWHCCRVRRSAGPGAPRSRAAERGACPERAPLAPGRARGWPAAAQGHGHGHDAALRGGDIAAAAAAVCPGGGRARSSCGRGNARLRRRCTCTQRVPRRRCSGRQRLQCRVTEVCLVAAWDGLLLLSSGSVQQWQWQCIQQWQCTTYYAYTRIIFITSSPGPQARASRGPTYAPAGTAQLR